MEERKLNVKQILIFLVITFAVTYGVEIFVIAPMVGSVDVNKAMLAQALIVMVMFIPALGVVLTRMITKEGFRGKDLYFSIHIKDDLKYYGIVWPLFAVLILAGAILYFLVFPAQYDRNMGYAAALFNAQLETPMTVREIKQVMIMQIAVGAVFAPFANIINCLGEEWGWRGYLLPKLLKQFKVVPAVLIDGIIWGIWHAPLIVLGHNYGTGYPGFPITGILAMCVFCVVIGTIFSYVTIKTNSCVPAILGHSMINGFATIGIYFTSLENPYNVFLGPAPTGIIGGTGFIVLAAYLLWKLHKEEKTSCHLKSEVL
ncbi:MAG: CPBP family intramembrane metalloprotease [Lachnospiraceae bacterium]|nr:CPBP family intramembrane metalloprotease [Lachnospiraceae bacterium]